MKFVFDRETKFDMEVIGIPGQEPGSIESVEVRFIAGNKLVPTNVWNLIDSSEQEKIKEEIYELMRDAKNEKAL